MNRFFAAALLCGLVFSSCTKPAVETLPLSATSARTADGFSCYVIKAGNHYCEGNVYKELQLSETKFSVRFDSTAIYTTTDPENQDDINKLWGFSDNEQQHHQFSARIGWRWSSGALRLFGYVYNEGIVSAKEITTVPIGAAVACRIAVKDGAYVFAVNGKEISLHRKSATALAKGYRLYPYFGGDEPAPHEVRIWLKEE
jgi:hypothetical protein